MKIEELKQKLTERNITVHADMDAPLNLIDGSIRPAYVKLFTSNDHLGDFLKYWDNLHTNFALYQYEPTDVHSIIRYAAW